MELNVISLKIDSVLFPPVQTLKIEKYVSFTPYLVFPFKLTAVRNRKKLAAVAAESQEEHPRSRQSRNTAVPQKHEDFLTQVSDGKKRPGDKETVSRVP